mmetsp:Transcript_3438/g.7117  ORF Transcript_3438/g.7117 Transcript_3438/m.7117 type:complete len:228 (-) Transcript_3438:928-1611(-)
MKSSLDLSTIRWRLSALCVLVVGAVDLSDVSFIVLDHLHALRPVGKPQAYFLARSQTEELGVCLLLKVITGDIQIPTEGHLSLSPVLLVWVICDLESFRLILRIVHNHNTERVVNGKSSVGVVVELFSHTVFEKIQLNHVLTFSDADALAEVPHCCRREASSPQTAQSRHPRVIPSPHHAVVHQFQELPLGHHHPSHVEPCELNLANSEDVQFFLQPLIERPVETEL